MNASAIDRKHKVISVVQPEDIPLAGPTPFGPGEQLLPVFRLATQMEKLCVELKGAGLSAPQVGVPWNFFVVSREGVYEYYINCSYTGEGEKLKSIEGCLSLRDSRGNLRYFEVDRYPAVLVKGVELKVVDGGLITEEFERNEIGFYGVVFQHEIDHALGRERMIDKIGQEMEIVR